MSISGGTGVAEPKRHDFEFEEPISCAEGCLFLIVGAHVNLPIPTYEIKGAEPFITDRVERVIDPQKRVGVLPGDGIHLPVVHTESCRPIFRTKTTGDAQGLLEG